MMLSTARAALAFTADPPALEGQGHVLMRVAASREQVYVASKDLAWGFDRAQATLTAAEGSKGKHYKGPTWELADGTKIVGQMIAQSVSPDANSVPWLLLKVASSSGSGPLAKATYVQRVETSGGKAPAKAATKEGEEL